MYNWWLTSFVVFASVFWGVEIIFTAAFWICFSMLLSSKDGSPTDKSRNESTVIKPETESTEDENPSKFKQEEQEPSLHEYPAATEADIEDEEDPEVPVMLGGPHRNAQSDSGLGTSMESGSAARDTLRKRSSRPTLDGE